MTQERDMPREDAEGDRGASLRDRAATPTGPRLGISWAEMDISDPRRGLLTEAAANIIDVWMGGDKGWRSRLDDSEFLESADWATALQLAGAALSPALTSAYCLDDNQLRRIVVRKFSKRGAAATFAEAHGISDETVLLFLRGKRPPGPTLLRCLGFERKSFYAIKPTPSIPSVEE